VSASPWTALGAKGISEGNTTSTPACIANAVADALGRSDVRLPLVPSRVAEWIHEAEPPRRAGGTPSPTDRALTGQGNVTVPETPERLWAMLLDPNMLAKIIPGCHSLDRAGPNAFRAAVTIGVGPVRGRFQALVKLSELEP